MLGKVGFWGNEVGGLSVAFGRDMWGWLQAQDKSGVDVIVTSDRRVIIMACENGVPVVHDGANAGVGYEHVARSARKPQCVCLDIDLPVFGLTEVDFIAEDGCLSGYLPSDHELEWPKLDLGCKTYDAAAIALETLQARLNSLVASGQTSFKDAHRMPMRLRRLLPQGAWADCVTTAKALAGGKI